VPAGLAAALGEVVAAELGDDAADADDVSELFSSSPPPQPATVAPTNTAAIAKPVADVRIMFPRFCSVTAKYDSYV
jgi:hypothetical protein